MNHAAAQRPVGIGIVTNHNLPLLEKCFESWRAPRNCLLAVFDNGSEPAVVDWLRHQPIDKLMLAPRNLGLSHARNRLISYFAELPEVDYVLLADPDVRFHEGMVEEMKAKMDSDPCAGFVAYPQANKGFPCSVEGYVEEVANECQLTRLSMWREIGLFPETVQYDSGDSWKSTIANMHGWRTVLVLGKQGYDHFQHGSLANPGVSEAMQREVALWQRMERAFEQYWKTRLQLGKGEQFRAITQYTEIPGWTDFEDVYANVVREAPPGSVLVEVGSWLGRSTALMCSLIRESGHPLTFFCVDTWKGSNDADSKQLVAEKGGDVFEVFHTNMRHWRGQYVPLRMTSLQASELFADQSLQFVFIDASHETADVLADIAAWKPKVKPGGLLAGHDIEWSTVKAAVDAALPGYTVSKTSWLFPVA